MRSNKIVVIGSSNTDLTISVPHIPAPGETILGGAFRAMAGGKGANQAVAATRLGGAVSFVARVGNDHYGKAALTALAQEGIDVTHVSTDKQAPSGVALILVSAKGENSIAVADSANGKLSPANIKRASRAIRDAGILVLQLEVPLETVYAGAALAAAAGVPVLLNPAPARDLPDTLLKNVTLLTPNESECELLTGIKLKNRAAISKAANVLLARGVKAVIVTLGKRGAFIATREIERLMPVFKVDPVDTTGAGDIFNGALAVAITEGKPLPEAVQFAQAAAAISVTRPGAQSSACKRKELESFLKRLY